MSDTGQIISPYRVAPAQGNIQDYGLFAQRAEQTEAMRVAQALAQATRQYLGQQAGLPGGVDPNAVQAYGGETQRQDLLGQQNTRANAQEGRQAQDHQSKYDYANGFMGTLPEQTDPVLRAAQQGGGVYGAELIGQLLGGQFQRQGEMQNRTQMNDADNAAAQQRLETELRMRNEAAVAEENRKTGVDTAQEEKIRQALVKGQTTGDWSDFYALAPNAVGSPTMYDREMQSKESAATAVAEQKRQEDIEKAKALKASPVGSIQGKNEKPVIPNQYFDPRVMTPRREGDNALQMQYDNIKNFLQFGPKTIKAGLEDGLGYSKQVLDFLRNNFRF